ncbi:MAG: Tetratricopeptide TPR_2 repeat protein, partial [uncultured Blastococcus sp.]
AGHFPRRRRVRVVSARCPVAAGGPSRSGGHPARPRRRRGTGVAQRPGGAGAGPVRRRSLPGGSHQLHRPDRAQPHRRLRPLRPRPGRRPGRGAAARCRAPCPRRRHAARPRPLRACAARGPGPAGGGVHV